MGVINVFLMLLGIAVLCGVILAVTERLAYEGGMFWWVIWVGLVSVLIYILHLVGEAYEVKSPCHRYEIHSQYNPATKSVMPYKVCAERGEWLK